VGRGLRSGRPRPPDSGLPRDDLQHLPDLQVVVWEGELALLPLPTMDPLKSMTRLRKSGAHAFRRVRKDEELGEEIVFEPAADGRPFRFKWHHNYYPRRR